MSEDSEPHFTITFGRAGRVVKRSGGGSDDGICGSGSLSGRKRSVKDRLGTTIVDDSLEDKSHDMFKRQKVENNQGSHRRNSSNDASLGNGDLRFKLMQKNVPFQSENNDPPTNMDLRDKLSSKATLKLGSRQTSPAAHGRRQASPAAHGRRQPSPAAHGRRQASPPAHGRRQASPPARGRRSLSPEATLGKRNNMLEARDIYDGMGHNMVEHRTYGGDRQSMREPRGAYRVERQNMRLPRGPYDSEKQSVRDPRRTYSVERQRMRGPRGRYSIERQSMRDRRDTVSGERRSMRGLRGRYSVERQSIRGRRDTYSPERQSMREPRDSYNDERRSMREPRDSYNVGRRSMREPRDTSNVERRSMQYPRDSYHAARQNLRERRETNSIARRSMQGPRDNFSVGRRSIREPRDSYSGERRSMREPRDACNGGKSTMLESRDGYDNRRMGGGKSTMLESRDGYDNRRMGNVAPGSRMGGDSPAVGHARMQYTSDNLRRRSPHRVYGSSISPERNVEELQRNASIGPYDDDPASVYGRNMVPSPRRTARSASILQQPGLGAAPRLPANPASVTAQFPQSNGAVSRIPNHGEQPTVDGFLQSLDLEEYSIIFKDEEVDFYALTQMNDPELHELGIPMGPRKRILHGLSAYRLQRGGEGRRGY